MTQVIVTGPDGQENVYNFDDPGSPILTDDLRQQAIREYLQSLVANHPVGSYFLLTLDADGKPALMHVSEMVQSAISLADYRRDGGC